MSRIRHGFTLVELIVVVAIVVILSAIAFPVTAHVIQASRATACVSNLANLGSALHLYLADHKEIMPNLQPLRASITDQVPVIDNTLNVYVSDPRVFACPADNAHLAATTGTSYYWNSLLDNQSITALVFAFNQGQTSLIPVLCDKQSFHPYTANQVNILYADGHASRDLDFSTSQ